MHFSSSTKYLCTRNHWYNVVSYSSERTKKTSWTKKKQQYYFVGYSLSELFFLFRPTHHTKVKHFVRRMQLFNLLHRKSCAREQNLWLNAHTKYTIFLLNQMVLGLLQFSLLHPHTHTHTENMQSRKHGCDFVEFGIFYDVNFS